MPLESVWELTEVNASQDLKKGKDFWAEAIRNLRKARDQVARRYNAVRKTTQFKVGDVVVHRLKVISSKGKGVSAKLELKWSKSMVTAKFFEAEFCTVCKRRNWSGCKEGSCVSIEKDTTRMGAFRLKTRNNWRRRQLAKNCISRDISC
jgi:hypothetical protein